MPSSLTSLSDEARIVLDNLADRTAGLVEPTLRLGVTGLSRAGKTVFISALVHNLLAGGRLPMFRAQQSGRIARTSLEPQPDDAVPRFQYEEHIDALVKDRVWPEFDARHLAASPDDRVRIRNAPGRASFPAAACPSTSSTIRANGCSTCRSFARTSANSREQAVALARSPARADLSARMARQCPARHRSREAKADESTARRLSEAFAGYLRACKADERALSTLPPGRFLMPGDLEGSPALTFAPLPDLPAGGAPRGSLWAMMERRFESYKSVVVKPFFRNHFARLDRQIVLVDALQAMNAGYEAVVDLERALSDILSCFRPGRNHWLSALLTRRIDRVLIAATKADHLHHESHDRLERIVRRLVDRAAKTIDFSGARLEVLALAAVRATREADVEQDGGTLPVIVGTPLAGEKINGETFDGETRTGIFPGDLPEDPEFLFKLPEAGENTAARARSELRPLPAAGARAHGRRHHPLAAAHPARPGPRIPDRRLARMSEEPPLRRARRPAAFRVEEPERPAPAPARPEARRMPAAVPATVAIVPDEEDHFIGGAGASHGRRQRTH